tara:strand:- start:552 stop:689 length:138 start_codon:yes stop_codon:yes gene_type:complete
MGYGPKRNPLFSNDEVAVALTPAEKAAKKAKKAGQTGCQECRQGC